MNKKTSHRLKIGFSETPKGKEKICGCRRITLRERILRLLFGEIRRVTIIVPGDSVRDITVHEVGEDAGK